MHSLSVGRNGHVGDRAELGRVDEAIGHLSQGRESREDDMLGRLRVGASGHVIRDGERLAGDSGLSVHCVTSRLVGSFSVGEGSDSGSLAPVPVVVTREAQLIGAVNQAVVTGPCTRDSVSTVGVVPLAAIGAA